MIIQFSIAWDKFVGVRFRTYTERDIYSNFSIDQILSKMLKSYATSS